MTFGAACARLTFTETGELSAITVEVVYEAPGDLGSLEPLPRHYLVTPEGTGPFSATLALCYTQEEFDASGVDSEDVLQAFRYDGADWVPYGSTVDPDGKVVTGTEVADFSQWTIGAPGPTTISLVSFTARPVAGAILLEWETGMEIDNLGFHLYRSLGPSGVLRRVNEALISSQQPGSPAGARYAFEDKTASPGVTYFYWLEALDVARVADRYGPVSARMASDRIYLPLISK
jgi:hypothetical protein